MSGLEEEEDLVSDLEELLSDSESNHADENPNTAKILSAKSSLGGPISDKRRVKEKSRRSISIKRRKAGDRDVGHRAKKKKVIDRNNDSDSGAEESVRDARSWARPRRDLARDFFRAERVRPPYHSSTREVDDLAARRADLVTEYPFPPPPRAYPQEAFVEEWPYRRRADARLLDYGAEQRERSEMERPGSPRRREPVYLVEPRFIQDREKYREERPEAARSRQEKRSPVSSHADRDARGDNRIFVKVSRNTNRQKCRYCDEFCDRRTFCLVQPEGADALQSDLAYTMRSNRCRRVWYFCKHFIAHIKEKSFGPYTAFEEKNALFGEDNFLLEKPETLCLLGAGDKFVLYNLYTTKQKIYADYFKKADRTGEKIFF